MPKKPNKDELLSLAEAAEHCVYDAATLRKLAWEGVLKARKFGNSWVTTLADIEAYESQKDPRGRRPKKDRT